MVVNLSKYKSHPSKELTVHTNGVRDKTKILTDLKIAEISAIFHDLGKMNPNFQNKLFPNKKVTGYSGHAYLSAYAFLCFISNKNNRNYLREIINDDTEFDNKIIAIITIVAKHHGNLPDFKNILNVNQCNELFDFLNNLEEEIPAFDFVNFFLPKTINFSLSKEPKSQFIFKEKLSYKQNNNALNYYLETQFAFASMIQADKTDAGDLDLTEERKQSKIFCQSYKENLVTYIKTLKQDSDLNQLRTELRNEVTEKLIFQLKNTEERLFALTAPTGSGKTLMLLDLAGQIIKEKGDFRIIYSIPFLSITEQVEKECLKIFGNDHIRRIDSKSENPIFQKLQETTDSNPTKHEEIITAKFIEDIFLSPFIITTFVRFFETLVSNINSTLLKLPSFSNCIFLIDEIQSLPPRLYTFFIAYLTAFCKRFNSFCIVSTATMPYFTIVDNDAQKFFSNYKEPKELLDSKYFDYQHFNRYKIELRTDNIDITQLALEIKNGKQSSLIILNTIEDTKNIYELLIEDFNESELILLNTHFTPNDRKNKIEYAKQCLLDKKKIILISTQLIEAGVDIDFPVLYRDMATIPSLIQSAGRCNRNGKMDSLGKVIIINLTKEGKERANLIYTGKKDQILLKTTKAVLKDQVYQENQLFKTQKDFFKSLGNDLAFGEHIQKKPEVEINFVKDINEMAFEKIGKFRLIDEDFYGEEFRCYVPIDEDDDAFQILINLDKEFREVINTFPKDFKQIQLAKILVGDHLKKMSNQIIQIRLKKDDIKPLYTNQYGDLFQIHKNSYSSSLGIILDSSNNII